MGRDGCCGKVLPGWSPAVGAVVGAESIYISLNPLGGYVYIFYDKVSYHVHPPSPITWFVQIDRSDKWMCRSTTLCKPLRPVDTLIDFYLSTKV